MRDYDRQYCAVCRNYSVHYSDGGAYACIHHDGRHEEDGFRPETLEKANLYLLNTALDWTYDALERRRA